MMRGALTILLAAGLLVPTAFAQDCSSEQKTLTKFQKKLQRKTKARDRTVANIAKLEARAPVVDERFAAKIQKQADIIAAAEALIAEQQPLCDGDPTADPPIEPDGKACNKINKATKKITKAGARTEKLVARRASRAERFAAKIASLTAKRDSLQAEVTQLEGQVAEAEAALAACQGGGGE